MQAVDRANMGQAIEQVLEWQQAVQVNSYLHA